MRQLFVTGIKLIGVYFLIDFITYMPMFIDDIIHSIENSSFEFVYSIIFPTFIQFLLGLLLIFKTDFILRIFRISDDDTVFGNSVNEYLRAGITLIGFFLFISNYQMVQYFLFQFFDLFYGDFSRRGILWLISNFLQITIPILVIIGAKGLANRINAYQDKRNDEISVMSIKDSRGGQQ